MTPLWTWRRNMTARAVLTLVLAVPAFGATTPLPAISHARPAATLAPADEAFLDQLQRASFRFFQEQTHPRTGLVRDRAAADGSPSDGKASIAASGFALSGWVIATHRGWVERDAAVERVRTMLRFLATEAPRQHGFFYHFMEMDTGARAWQCEVSPIDTSLFLAGAIVAREYFGDPEITNLVNGIYAKIDWPWFLNGGKTLALCWEDESGFSRYRWDHFSEQMVMSLLAIGSPSAAVDGGLWQAWSRGPFFTYGNRNFLHGAPLFIHQFSHAYVDFRGRRDAHADYFRNSVLATQAHRQFCIDLQNEFPSWGEQLWGVTASDTARGYMAWGGPPRAWGGARLDGTLVPCAAAGSLPFAPDEALTTLQHMRTEFGDQIWQRYGFADAFNPENGWVADDVIGIDLGITLVQAENTRSGLIWALFNRAPEITRALSIAGFISTERQLANAETQALRQLASDLWRTFSPAVPIEPNAAGLRLTMIAAANALGLLPASDASAAARAALQSSAPRSSDVALSQYAAGLITLRQAFPGLAAEATGRLEALRWADVVLSSSELGSASRLAAFFQVASGAQPPETWSALRRTAIRRGSVHVLAPGNVAGKVLPSLWLAERNIITGASAAQLAYVYASSLHQDPSPEMPRDALAMALLLDHFPSRTVRYMMSTLSLTENLTASPAEDRAALVVTLANLLASNCVRQWFQKDALVQAGRAAIAEFEEAAFGPSTAVLARRELAGPRSIPPARRAIVRPVGSPRGEWDWQTVSGLEFRDSSAELRSGDPAIELRFAFTWSESTLRFHAEAMDTPPGFERPRHRHEAVELWVDPDNDGIDGISPNDHQFSFQPNGRARDLRRAQPLPAKIIRTEHGYTIEAAIPWSALGIVPRIGLEVGVTASIFAGGPGTSRPILKLNWRNYQDEDGVNQLGTLHLE